MRTTTSLPPEVIAKNGYGGIRGRRPTDRTARFWSLVSPEPNTGCWLWCGQEVFGGYGAFWGGRRTVKAHRFSYEIKFGAVPPGFQLDHLCRVRLCVNPDHLEPVTHRENCLRGISFSAANAKKTHCIHGHELTADNLMPRKDSRRICRECHKKSSLKSCRGWRARQRLLRAEWLTREKR